jgi:hypothetical protein
MSTYYGVLLGGVKEFYIVTVQNGSHAHIKVNAGSSFNVRMELGSTKSDIYYTVFTTTDQAVQSYLLPIIEGHLNTDWINNFNILAQNGTSGALDFFRTPSLYAHISNTPGMTKNVSTTAPSNARITDTTITLSTNQLTAKYGALATAIRTMFTIYSSRQIIVFGRQTPSRSAGQSAPLATGQTPGRVDTTIRNVSFSQELDKCGKPIVPFTDGAIFFYDPKNHLLDGIFTMTSKQYSDFIHPLN